MHFRDRLLMVLFVMVAVGLCAGVPVLGQDAQNSDSGGALPMSDASGGLTQSDLAYFQSDDAQVRLDDVAESLAQALRSGTLGASVVEGRQSMSVPPAVADVIAPASDQEAERRSQSFGNDLRAQGLPQAEATVLAEAVSGLLEGGSVDSDQLVRALTAFNEAVDAAPPGFLAQPPHEFLVVRAVLSALLQVEE